MTKSFYRISFIVLALLFAAFLIVLRPTIGHANPSTFVRSNTSSATTLASSLATTTVAWQTSGFATTSIVLNTNIGTNQTVDSLALKLSRTAASPVSQTRIVIEQSANCDATVPDWYQVATSTATTFGSFTTNSNGMIWTFASSTYAGSLIASNFDSLIIPIPIFDRCVRAVLTVPAGAASSSIYAEWVGKRQVNN